MLDSELFNPVDPHLARLHKWLSFQLFPAALFGASFFGPAAFMLGLAHIAAICFTPVMLWSLFRLERWGWILVFALGVAGPTLVQAPSVGLVGSYLLESLPLIFFYLFTLTLKTASAGWLEKDQGDALLAYYDRKYAATPASEDRLPTPASSSRTSRQSAPGLPQA